MSQPNPLCVDIDVSKTTLDIATANNEFAQFIAGNDADGFELIIAELGKHSVVLILMEATDELEAAVACPLQTEGFDIAVINPRQVRDFSRAMGHLAKTGRIDAKVLSQMAEVMNRHPGRGRFIKAILDAERQILATMAICRRQLITILVAERNRLHPTHPRNRKSINTIIKALEDELSRISEAMNNHTKTHFKELAARLSSIKGVGAMTVATLLSEVPELGSLSRREVNTLISVAPVNRDSGTAHDRRTIFGGGAGVRTALYMAALVATRFNPVIKDLYTRLITAGEVRKIALVAYMRKLLTILDAMIRKNEGWSGSYHRSSLQISCSRQLLTSRRSFTGIPGA